MHNFCEKTTDTKFGVVLSTESNIIYDDNILAFIICYCYPIATDCTLIASIIHHSHLFKYILLYYEYILVYYEYISLYYEYILLYCKYMLL